MEIIRFIALSLYNNLLILLQSSQQLRLLEIQFALLSSITKPKTN